MKAGGHPWGMLTNSDIQELTEFRRHLHMMPEVSREEAATAAEITTALKALSPDEIITGLGGHGVAAVFNGLSPGPTVLFRAELDALPIHEVSDHPWRSQVDGKGHLCGHDGHMVMLLGLGRLLSRQRPARGRVVLMFQPAEEDGSGARAVVHDPAFGPLKPDWAFAIHNEPGRTFGHVSTKVGLVNCASEGLALEFSGVTTHAATPEAGQSPALALAELIPGLLALGSGGELGEAFRLVTITHVEMGEPTFGISPGSGRLFATLRTGHDDPMAALEAQALRLASEVAERHVLQVSHEVHDAFAASINAPEAVAVARAAMDAVGVRHNEDNLPMRASEDFGVFGWDAKAAMLCLGSGEDHPALHNPDYDFPDDLIPIGISVFHRIALDLLG